VRRPGGPPAPGGPALPGLPSVLVSGLLRSGLLRSGLPSLLGLLTLLGLLVAAPAADAVVVRPPGVVDVRLTQDGPRPARLLVGPGDVVRFVNADAFVHRVVGRQPGWVFDTGPVLPGRGRQVVAVPRAAGTYVYRGSGLDRFTGSVVVPADVSGAAGPAVPSGAATPTTTGSAPAAVSPRTASTGSPSTGTASSAVPAAAPGLSSPVRLRRAGLPVALATVLLLGVGSLLVRLLLAEPPR
jgi:plastocyanin